MKLWRNPRHRRPELLRAEIARTVLTPEDLESERSYLLGLFQRR